MPRQHGILNCAKLAKLAVQSCVYIHTWNSQVCVYKVTPLRYSEVLLKYVRWGCFLAIDYFVF